MIRVNTISEMAAQNLPYAWIMRLGFIGFGVILCMALVKMSMATEISWLVSVPFIVYALSIVATGFWSTNFPGLEEANLAEAGMHSFFATLAGFGLTVTVLVSAFKTPSPKIRWIHWGFVVLISVISLLFISFPEYQGYIQRFLYASSFIWMIKYFGR